MAYGTITFFSNVLGYDASVDYLLPDTRRRARKWTDWEDKKIPVIGSCMETVTAVTPGSARAPSSSMPASMTWQ